jgi:hypothetical protein
MALVDICLAHWDLDETSGFRSDSDSTNTLSDNNTVGYAGGLLGNAASFVAANSEYLSNAGTNLRVADWTIAMWVYSTSWAGGYGAASIWQSTNNDRCWRLAIVGSGVILQASADGTFGGSVSATKSITLNTSTWYFVTAGVSGTTVWANVNASGTRGTNTMAGAMYTSNTQSFFLGRSDSAYFNGLMDHVSFFYDELTPAEETTLYNGGSPLAYPFTVASPAGGLPGRRMPRGVGRGLLRGVA